MVKPQATYQQMSKDLSLTDASYDNQCYGEITPRKETFVQSRVYDVIRDSREHVEKRRRIRTAMLA